MANEYVKFIRGTAAAYEKLTTKQSDTLYFIYDKDNATASGTLYLGTHKIGIADASELDLNINSALFEQDAETKLLSLKNYGKKYWELGEDGTYVEITVDGNTHTWDGAGLTPKLGVVGEGDNLHYELQWYKPSAKTPEELQGSIDDLRKSINELKSISLTRIIVDSVGSINKDADNADRYIYLVKRETTEDNNNDQYDEYIVVVNPETSEKSIERIGRNEIDLSGYVTTSDFDALKADHDVVKVEVGDLATILGYSKDAENNTSKSTLKNKLEVIGTALGVEEDAENELGFKVTVAPVGNLNDLLVKNDNNETPENLVAAINVLDSKLKWQDLT